MGLQFFPRGGSAHVAGNLARALPAAGWVAAIACGSVDVPGRPGNARAFFRGIEVHPLDMTSALAAPDPMLASPPLHPSYEDRPGAPDRVFCALDDHAYRHQVRAWAHALAAAGAAAADVLHLHHLTPLNAAAHRVAPDVPVVGHLHGTELLMAEAVREDPDRWPHARAWLERMRRWAQRAERLVVLSASQVERAEGLLGIDPERCVRIPNGFDPEVFRPRHVDRLAFWHERLVADPRGWAPGDEAGSVGYETADLEAFAGDAPVLTYVGRFTAVKRLPVLLEAFASAQAGFARRAPLVLVGGFPGEWEGEHPLETVRRLGLRDVFLAGWHGHEALPDFLAASDVVVLPSVREQFGQVLVEGMACALPCIAVDAHGPATIVDHGRDGLARGARRPRLARQRAGRGRQPAGGAPPPRGRGPGRRRVARYGWPALARRARRASTRTSRSPRRSCSPGDRLRHCYDSGPSPRAHPPSRATHTCRFASAQPSGSACTTRHTSTTRAASRSSPAWTAARATRRWTGRSSRSRTWSTAGRRAPTRNTGDGAGILMQVPDEFFRGLAGDALPPRGAYGVGVLFLPQDEARRAELEELLTRTIEAEGQRVVMWRDVPTDKDWCGITAFYHRPYVKHVVIAASEALAGDQDAFERKLYVIRKLAEHAAGPDLVVPSMSSRTIVYKGMLTPLQLRGYYPDLQDPRVKTAVALVHSRFSTNTFPSLGARAPVPDDRPQRRDQHAARQRQLDARAGVPARVRALRGRPAEVPAGRAPRRVGLRDARQRARAARAGRPQPAARDDDARSREAFEDRDDMPEHLRAFYAFHACFMEPWDGPAAVAFTDGRVIGATLDRNGLRPGRWLETKDGWVIVGSEAGMLDEPADNIARKGRLAPGKLFLVDLEQGRIVPDEEVKAEVATAQPYGDWYREGVVALDDLPDREPQVVHAGSPAARQQAFGWTQEDLRLTLAPMARDAAEPTGSMGNDLALAVLSDKAPPLFSYFKQLFAQVTNPPIDPIRESIVMSLTSGVGAEENLLEESPDHAHQLAISQPILRQHELERLRQVDHSIFWAHTIDITWPAEDGAKGMGHALHRICTEASEVVEDGVNVLILSDRRVGPGRAAVPSLLATAAVHHHLVREGTRLKTGLVVESGEPREVHHFCTLIGYGASAVAPYLMFESVAELARDGRIPDVDDPDEAERRVVKAIGKGLLKTISKMGISTIQSYCGAQIFEAVGLEPDLVARVFTGTASRIGGIGLDVLAAEALERHERGFPTPRSLPRPRPGRTRRPRTSCRSAAPTSGGATASAASGTRSRSRCCRSRRARAPGPPTSSSPPT